MDFWVDTLPLLSLAKPGLWFQVSSINHSPPEMPIFEVEDIVDVHITDYFQILSKGHLEFWVWIKLLFTALGHRYGGATWNGQMADVQMEVERTDRQKDIRRTDSLKTDRWRQTDGKWTQTETDRRKTDKCKTERWRMDNCGWTCRGNRLWVLLKVNTYVTEQLRRPTVPWWTSSRLNNKQQSARRIASFLR